MFHGHISEERNPPWNKVPQHNVISKLHLEFKLLSQDCFYISAERGQMMTKWTTRMNRPLISRGGGREVCWRQHTHTHAHTLVYLHAAHVALASYLHTQLAYTPLSCWQAHMSEKSTLLTKPESHCAMSPRPTQTYNSSSHLSTHTHTHTRTANISQECYGAQQAKADRRYAQCQGMMGWIRLMTLLPWHPCTLSHLSLLTVCYAINLN